MSRNAWIAAVVVVLLAIGLVWAWSSSRASAQTSSAALEAGPQVGPSGGVPASP